MTARRLSRFILVFAALALAPGLDGSSAIAGGSPTQTPTRLRVTVAEPSERGTTTRTIKGDLLAINDSTLVLETSSSKQPVVLPLRDITKLERSVSPSRRGRGALIGFFSGAALGALIGVTSGDDPESDFISLSAEVKAVGLGLMLAPVGMLLGLVVAPGERWETIPPDRIQLWLARPVDGP